MLKDVKHSRRHFLATSLSILAATPLGMLACSDLQLGRTTSADPSNDKDNDAMQRFPQLTIPLPVEGEMPSFGGAIDWLKSDPLTPDGLRGNVILVEFWTYTCINWLRTLPYVRAWSQKYQDQGLVVIGVHTPEFSFEHNLDNVHKLTHDLKVDYP